MPESFVQYIHKLLASLSMTTASDREVTPSHSVPLIVKPDNKKIHFLDADVKFLSLYLPPTDLTVLTSGPTE